MERYVSLYPKHEASPANTVQVMAGLIINTTLPHLCVKVMLPNSPHLNANCGEVSTERRISVKNFARSVIGCLLVLSLLVAAAPLSAASCAATNISQQEKRQKDFDVKRGPEISAYVKRLKQNSKAVRDALGVFEKKGRAPKIEEAFAITGKVSQANQLSHRSCSYCGTFQKASYKRAQIAGDNVDMIFVPAISEPGQWQGTVISH
jgi:hypothetical protein